MDNVVKQKRFLKSVNGRKEYETEIQSNGQCSSFSHAADWMRFYNDIESKGFIQFQQYYDGQAAFVGQKDKQKSPVYSSLPIITSRAIISQSIKYQ